MHDGKIFLRFNVKVTRIRNSCNMAPCQIDRLRQAPKIDWASHTMSQRDLIAVKRSRNFRFLSKIPSRDIEFRLFGN